MTYALFFSFALTLLLLSCSTIPSKKSDDDFATLWLPVISSFSNKNGPKLNLSYDVSTDLLRYNQNELAAIGSQWHQLNHEGLDKKELRKRENQFYFDRIATLNNDLIDIIDKISRAGMHGQNYSALVKTIIDTIESNPVSSSKAALTFKDGNQIGFCFGRALLAHYLLLKAGVPPQDILKIFSIGELKVEHQFWSFHVAIMVRDAEHGFIVVDPLQTTTLAYKNWMDANHRYSVKYPHSRVRFYVTDARKFMPAHGSYNLQSLSHPVLEDYFTQLGREIRTTFARDLVVQKP